MKVGTFLLALAIIGIGTICIIAEIEAQAKVTSDEV